MPSLQCFQRRYFMWYFTGRYFTGKSKNRLNLTVCLPGVTYTFSMQCRENICEAGTVIHPWFINDKQHLQVVLLFVFPLFIFLAHCINSQPSSHFSKKMWLAYAPFFLPPMTNSSVSTFNTLLEMSVLPLDILGLHLPCFIVTNSDHTENTTVNLNQGFCADLSPFTGKSCRLFTGSKM